MNNQKTPSFRAQVSLASVGAQLRFEHLSTPYVAGSHKSSSQGWLHATSNNYYACEFQDLAFDFIYVGKQCYLIKSPNFALAASDNGYIGAYQVGHHWKLQSPVSDGLIVPSPEMVGHTLEVNLINHSRNDSALRLYNRQAITDSRWHSYVTDANGEPTSITLHIVALLDTADGHVVRTHLH